MRGGLSCRAAIAQAGKETGVRMSLAGAGKAKLAMDSSGAPVSPEKKGPLPAYPPALEEGLYACVLSSRERGVRTTVAWTAVLAAHLLVGTAAEEHFTNKDGHVVVSHQWVRRHISRSWGRQCFGGFRWVPLIDPGHRRPQACPFTTPASGFFPLCSFTESA